MKLTFDTRPRYGHNHATSVAHPFWSKITYVAHGRGYVMVRRPQCTPFVLTEKQWLEFPLYAGQAAARAALAEESGGDR